MRGPVCVDQDLVAVIDALGGDAAGIAGFGGQRDIRRGEWPRRPGWSLAQMQEPWVWIDLVVAGAKSASEALLAGKPAVLVVVRGGAYGAGTPREGWDHSTGYLRRIVADVWGADLTIVEREFTLVGVNPALDEFKEVADKLKEAAHQAAAEAGRALAAV